MQLSQVEPEVVVRWLDLHRGHLSSTNCVALCAPSIDQLCTCELQYSFNLRFTATVVHVEVAFSSSIASRPLLYIVRHIQLVSGGARWVPHQFCSGDIQSSSAESNFLLKCKSMLLTSVVIIVY